MDFHGRKSLLGAQRQGSHGRGGLVGRSEARLGLGFRSLAQATGRMMGTQKQQQGWEFAPCGLVGVCGCPCLT